MPVNSNMIAIQTITVGSGGAASIDFQNIPQTYTDLVVYLSARNTTSSYQGERLYFNNSNADLRSNYLLSSGGGTQASNAATGYFGSVQGTGQVANAFDNTFIYISNYSSTSLVKTFSADNSASNNTTSSYVGIANGTWNSTAAITRVTLYPDGGGNYAEFSSATLYGVTNARYSAKAAGGIITSDSTYWYHTFTNTAVFTPNQTITADYLVVAGGGGAGSTFGDWGGGPGGAGGYRTFSSVSFANATNYTVTVGAGGTSTAGAGATGGKGGTSSVIGGAISSSSTGGGGGGTTKENGGSQTNGQTGGSGGGAPQNTVAVSAGAGNEGGYSPVEGFAGGAVNGGSPYVAGQGGGSSAVGLSNSAQSPTGIATTNGTSNSISGTSVIYSRGGYFIVSTTGLNGPAQSGWGGLSAGTNGANGQGGSGIVIIRYTK
jgi:hypothetical protein